MTIEVLCIIKFKYAYGTQHMLHKLLFAFMVMHFSRLISQEVATHLLTT